MMISVYGEHVFLLNRALYNSNRGCMTTSRTYELIQRLLAPLYVTRDPGGIDPTRVSTTFVVTSPSKFLVPFDGMECVGLIVGCAG